MHRLTQAAATLADKAYDADDRGPKKLEDKGIQVLIPFKNNRLAPVHYDKNLYKVRHLIENLFAKLKQYRAIPARYDKTAQNFLGAIHLASILVWLN